MLLLTYEPTDADNSVVVIKAVDWGRMMRVKGVKYKETEGDYTWGDEHTMESTDAVL